MHFAFQGFEQHEGSRKLKFLCVKDNRPAGTLALSVNIRLLVDAGISLQEAPALCVQILKAASETSDAAEAVMGAYQDYALTAQDLAAFTAPRKAQAAEREKRKGSRPSRPRTAPFQPFGQPINLSARPL